MAKEKLFGDMAPPPIVLGMLMVFVAFEAVFWMADTGVLPYPDLHWNVFLQLAFFDVYFEGVRDGLEVPWTFWTSFLTYSVLHGGLLHLMMNGVFFVSVGGLLARVLGPVRFLILFAVTSITGAAVFGLLADAQGPMVGASGALFGFIGALKSWEWKYIRATGASSQRFWRTILALVAMNVLLAIAFAGQATLAWEAHLGGFVGGFLLAPVLAPKLAAPSPF